jgi:hypothetical protein
MPFNKGSAFKLKRAEDRTARIEREVELRKAGLSYKQIGKALGVSHVTVYNDITKAMQKLNDRQADSADIIRRIESERLDQLQQGLWGDALKGDTKAVQQILNIMERRARMWGIDAPTKQEISGDGMTIKVVLRGNGNS